MEFTDDLKTGVPAIDEQHKTFFLAINKLIKALKEGLSEGEIEGALLYIEVYSNSHFKAEEHYMSLSKWPDTAKHKKEHASFKADIEKLRVQLSTCEQGNEKMVQLTEFMMRWLVHHINDTDKKFVAFLCENDIEFVGDLPVTVS